MADPKASKTAEIPAATTAPATTAPQLTERGTATPSILISVQAEERQNGNNHDHKADQINYAIHENLPDFMVNEGRGTIVPLRSRFVIR
jgi:hypothetical protein